MPGILVPWGPTVIIPPRRENIYSRTLKWALYKVDAFMTAASLRAKFRSLEYSQRLEATAFCSKGIMGLTTRSFLCGAEIGGTVNASGVAIIEGFRSRINFLAWLKFKLEGFFIIVSFEALLDILRAK